MTSIRSRRRRAFTEAAGLHVISPLLAMLVPVLAVRSLGAELWGGMVLVSLACGLAASIVNWGQRDALLRDLAEAPNEMPRLWQQGLCARMLWVFPPVALVLVLVLARAKPELSFTALGLAVLWVAAQAVARSGDAVVLRRRLFGARMLIDLGGVAAQLSGLGLLATQGTPSLGTLVALFAITEVARAGAVLWLTREALAPSGSVLPQGGELRAALPYLAVGVSGLLSSRIDSYLLAGLLAAQSLAMYQALTMGFGLLQRAVALMPVVNAVPLLRLPKDGIQRLMWRNLGFGLIGAAVAIPGVQIAVRVLFWV